MAPQNYQRFLQQYDYFAENGGKENSVEKEEKSQTKKYNPGSIIWAKYGKYPWWPSIVDMDPDSGAYNKMFENNTEMYHVSFLDAQPTHAWVSETLIRPFSPLPAELKKIKKFDFLTSNAMARAQEAEKLPNEERLKKFSFAMNTPRHRSISTNSGRSAESKKDVQCSRKKRCVLQKKEGKLTTDSKRTPGEGLNISATGILNNQETRKRTEEK
ncbi:hypothetical protein TNIN_355761 [Trichonephila inaurata madagascariensis]|uniref:PWWP domain-containing protein n=1 Tax=Trichonephila inaurata madagascariensis TaxID=2747483 RepID=A0A8X6YEL8_9ARAC|nr:hypothetical protein TNIN_355761 [Trichonephila inaurata madagascariensis]